VRSKKQSRLAALAAAGVLGCAAVAGAQPQATPDKQSDAEVLRDLVHFIQIDQFSAAESYAKELIKRLQAKAESEIALLSLVEEGAEIDRFLDSMAEGVRVATTRDEAEALLAMYEGGRLKRARHSDEIEANIKLLEGSARGRIFARERLIFAGEYAMPKLLNVMLGNSSAALQSEVRGVIIRMGRQAIGPLTAALPQLDPGRQEIVVNLLGQIEYRTWLPFVLELRQSTASSQVAEACDRALARLTGGAAVEGDPAYWFYELAERYYAEKNEVTSFPSEGTQLVWDFNPGVGLIPVPVATDVFHEMMAMRLCERSLRHRTADNDALGLWLASNFSRELDSASGYVNPLYAADRPEAMYYAVAFGQSQAQWVLARALDTRDTPLARRAIAAIEQTAGADAMRMPLVLGTGDSAADRRPLVEALGYPNRRVQYEAALALARSQPVVMFGGSERVVPLLAGAIRDASKRYGVVLTLDSERARVLRAFLEGRGFTVYAGTSLDEIAEPLASVPGVDVVLADYSEDRMVGEMERIRSDNRLSSTPVMMVATGEDFNRLSTLFAGDQTVSVRRAGITENMMGVSLDELLLTASGGVISEDEARDYAAGALDAMRDLAVANNPVFNVADAAPSLMAALADLRGGQRLKVAEVLSRINQQRVQQALVDASLGASGIERLELLRHAAESAKRFGGMLEARQIASLRGVVQSATGAEGTAAAALMGSLAPAIDDVLPLVVPAGDRRASER
jgi:CheY-like chemotaxis protein